MALPGQRSMSDPNRSAMAALADTAAALAVFPDRTALRTRGYQTRQLRACGVDPALYHDHAETGLFGQDCFKSMITGGQTLDGMVHLAQRFVLLQRIGFDEPLRQRGRIVSDEEDARGRRIRQDFVFLRADASVAVVAEMYRLIPDPARMGGSRGTRRSDADPRDGLTFVEEKRMRPKDVTGFSADVGNLIHFDPDFAGQLGYRTPIAQGIQTMIWMMGQLARRRSPKALDVTARFVRPVHWDETLSLWAISARDAAPDLVRAVNRDGRSVAELRVDSVTY